ARAGPAPAPGPGAAGRGRPGGPGPAALRGAVEPGGRLPAGPGPGGGEQAPRPGHAPSAPGPLPGRPDGVRAMNGPPALDASPESRMGRVVDEFLDRLARGEQPAVEEYVGRYPELAAVLQDMLPALQLLQAAGSGSAGEAPGAEPALSGCL